MTRILITAAAGCILTGGMLLLLLLWGIFSHRLTAYAQKQLTNNGSICE